MLTACPATAQEHGSHAHDGHDMQFDARGMVMNSNRDRLPLNCQQISADVEFTVYAGAGQAARFPGRTFAYSEHEFRVPPCARVSIHFFNEDQVRHQWMLHGLPRYLYPQGMFHLEAAGGEHVMGSFIVPADDATYLIHCDITQHMEKGMKAQLLVGRGGGNLWSIPGISASFRVYREVPGFPLWPIMAGLLLALAVTVLVFYVRASRNTNTGE
jgi:hypothetical protein